MVEKLAKEFYGELLLLTKESALQAFFIWLEKRDFKPHIESIN